MSYVNKLHLSSMKSENKVRVASENKPVSLLVPLEKALRGFPHFGEVDRCQMAGKS